MRELVDEQITFRMMNKEDAPFISGTWLRGLYFGCPLFKWIPREIYNECYGKKIYQVVTHPQTEIEIACLKDDPKVVVGYAVYHPEDVLHWIYVKPVWRKVGIASMLYRNKCRVTTHLSVIGQAIIKKREDIIYNPFLF